LAEALEKIFPLHSTRPSKVLEYLHGFDHQLRVPVVCGVLIKMRL